MKINWKILLSSVVICLLMGLVGSIFTSQTVGWWYPMLHKPAFSPPAWVFAPVWTTLYILMGISLYLVWMKKGKKKDRSEAIAIFAVQLLLNAVWSFLFFGLRSPFLGLIDIVVLWLAILLTIARFMKVNQAAAYLLIPYLLWVSFASVLNLFIVLLN